MEMENSLMNQTEEVSSKPRNIKRSERLKEVM